jgi:DNA-binding NarL/FixJ family response regulator
MTEGDPPGVGTIAIVEDDPVVSEYLVEIVSHSTPYEVIGVAGTVRAARSLIARAPSIFLLDIGLPDGSGLDLVYEIKTATDARVLMLTSFGDRDTVVRAIEAGADGYLLKDSDAPTLLQGIAVTLAGGAPISAAAAVFLLERLRPAVPARAPTSEKDLTDREIDLLRLFARGASYKEAARSLGISPLTVGSYVKSIYRKLAVHSRGEAVYEAVKARKLDLD